MNISLSTSVAGGPATSRSLVATREQAPVVPEKPDAPRKKDPMARMAAATERSQRRVNGNVGKGPLTTRQAMALEKVQNQFDRMTKRLQGAMDSQGADRSDLREGLDIVYGKLRDSLSDILAAGEPKQPVPGAQGHPEQFSGLVLNKLG